MSSLKKTGSTTAWRKIRATVIARDQNSCVICGRDDIKLEVDHILERNRGGTDNLENLQTLCEICHKNKTNRFFCSRKPPLPIAWPLSLQKGTTRAHNSQMSVIDGDEVFGV